MVTMHNWFETKIQYEKLSTDDGKQKKSSDSYLVDAMSFTEAEARIIKAVTPYMTGEFTVANIKRSKIYEIFESPEGDRWYRAKVLFIILDEEKGVEKKVPSTMMIQASDIQSALVRLNEGMKGTMSDFEIASICDTPILDIYPYGVDSINDQKQDDEQ